MRRSIVLLCLALAGIVAAPASAATPTVTTGAASATSTTAHLDGLVSRNGEDTSYYFEYGTTTAYGSQTTSAVLVDGSSTGGCPGCNPVSAELSGLSPSTTFHFRLVAENGSGKVEGDDSTFTTAAQQQPPPDLDGDGVPDNQDQCADRPGPASMGGCPPPPDTDGDGTSDAADACPSVPGPPDFGGCPPPAPAGSTTGPKAPGDDPNDLDNDGVANALDKCAQTFASETVAANGCGPLLARATFGARDTREIQKSDFHGQCENGAGRQCRFHLTLTLNKASARKLGIKARIANVTFTTDKSTFGGKYVWNKRKLKFSAAVRKALKRAHAKRIPVTMTFTGTYVLGSGKTVALPKSTFTMKHKPPATGAYRISPSVEHGDKGSSATGLTRKKIEGDF